MDEEEGSGEWEEQAHFAGTCACDHDSEAHGWGSCAVDDCVCEAGWEE